ncbi:MAG: hypothetical protein QNJ45_08960 [Ardenticatenaceae bacterium]|nr:hypothetical protein [Ardenticatenaceae bacterium]
MQKNNFKNVKVVWTSVLLLFLAACGAGERLAEEAVEQMVGEGAVATSEAFVAAAATESAALLTPEAGEADSQPVVQVEEAVEPSAGQNDANSGADAGMMDDPTPLEAGSAYPGHLTGVQNGGDMFDAYQIRAAAHEIVRVVVTGSGDNTGEIQFNLSNSDGYDAAQVVLPGSSAELVLASANENLYELTISHDGLADTVNYTFDVVIEPENDINSGLDAPNTQEQALPVESGGSYNGASIGNGTGANDVDCYMANIPEEGGSLSVDLGAPTDQPYESFVGGELYTPDGELITSTTAAYGSGALLEFGVADYEVAAAGDYKLCLSSYSFYAYGEYEFSVTVTDAAGSIVGSTGEVSSGAAVHGSGNDACLEGTWRVANFDAYLVASVETATANTGQDLEISSTSSGDLLISFDGRSMTMSENGFTVTMSMMGVTVPTAIDASGRATYTADGSVLQGDIEAVEVVESSAGFGLSLGGLVGNPVNYVCSGETMTWFGPYAIPIELEKLSS